MFRKLTVLPIRIKCLLFGHNMVYYGGANLLHKNVAYFRCSRCGRHMEKVLWKQKGEWEYDN